MTTDSITATIELARSGDTGAFAQIVRQYQSLVSGVLYSATGDFHKSEDLAQETFLIAWQKLGELKNSDHLATWLCTIARNLVHRSHRKPTLPTVPLTDKTGRPTPAAHAPDAELLRREQSEFVWSAIGELDEKYRETLVMYYRSGQSASEIAAAMDLTEEAVWQRLARARKSLKAKLEEMVGTILTATAPGEAFTLTVMTALGTAMFTTTTAQAAVVATTGTTVATGAATGGKTLSSETLWSVLGSAALHVLIVAMIFLSHWTGVRNTPTLRSRRFRVYSFFWGFQYFGFLFGVVYGIPAIAQLIDPKIASIAYNLINSGPVQFGAVVLVLSMCLAFYLKLRKIVENDLGLSSTYVESYSYPQVERRFFLSIFTNILLALPLIAFITIPSILAGKYHPFYPVLIPMVAIVAIVYYPLGRYFLKICRTKRNFLAAPPLVDNPFEITMVKWRYELDAQTLEAIERYDPITMTADEPVVEAKPFPRHWFWFLGFYAAAIVVMWCLGVLFAP